MPASWRVSQRSETTESPWLGGRRSGQTLGFNRGCRCRQLLLFLPLLLQSALLLEFTLAVHLAHRRSLSCRHPERPFVVLAPFPQRLRLRAGKSWAKVLT